MPGKIEDYALIGDTQTAALVGRDGSIDWLCLPRFDSGACFAALLGGPENGHWSLAPAGRVIRAHRRYREGTLVLETSYETEDGEVSVIDCMPPRQRRADVFRLVEGKRGSVPMRMELLMRFDYGRIVPWVRRVGGGLTAVAGPDALRLRSDVHFRSENFKTFADFRVSRGQRVRFDLAWHPSHERAPREADLDRAIDDTERWWLDWSGRCTHRGPWREAVMRSLITLKALTYAPTGGIIAAPTTSLPEQLGGVRNWDYRYCWLRDATFTLDALLISGYLEEARAWREWLLRAVAGQPEEMQIMYGPAGERRLTEFEAPWLPGYEGSSPVRIGNAAHRQFQLDVYGELMDAMHEARRAGTSPDPFAWGLQRHLIEFLESAWDKPDEGIWEVRGPRRHFTHSKVMAWVAMDRAVKAVEGFGLKGPVDEWRRTRARIHEEVCRKGFDADLGAFVQHYGSKQLDASLLMIPLVGFLPPSDARVRGTVREIERTLMSDGFVARYLTSETADGLPPGEGAFLACTFWYADNLVLQGRREEARRIFERLLELRNDVGLLAEEYDTHRKRLVGNFPQAFSHVALVNTARNLSEEGGPAEERGRAEARASTPERSG